MVSVTQSPKIARGAVVPAYNRLARENASREKREVRKKDYVCETGAPPNSNTRPRESICRGRKAFENSRVSIL